MGHQGEKGEKGEKWPPKAKGTKKMARTKASVLNARRAKELKRLRDDVCQLMFDEKENLSDNAYVKMGEVLKNSRNRERDDSPEEEDDEIAPVWCRVVYLRGKVKRSDDGTTYVDQTVKHRNIRIPRIVMETVRMQIEKEYASCFHFMVSIFAEDMDDDDDGHAGINEREEAFLEDLIEQLDDDDLRNKKIVRLTPIE